MNRGPSKSCTTGRSGTGKWLSATSRHAMLTGTRPFTIRRSSGWSAPSTNLAASRAPVARTTAGARATDLAVQPLPHARLRQGTRFGRAERYEQAEERQLVPRIQEIGAQEPDRVCREGAQLSLLQHEGVFRDAVLIGDAKLLEDPRRRAAGVEGVPAAIEAEAVDVLRRRAASYFRRLLEDGHVHSGSGKIAGD